MKITRPPDNENPYLIAMDLARKEAKTCPFCHSEENVYEAWTKRKKDIGFIRRETVEWLSFYCRSCGARWESEPFCTGERKPSPLLWNVVTIILYALVAWSLCISGEQHPIAMALFTIPIIFVSNFFYFMLVEE